MTTGELSLAACGIDCSSCEIYKASDDRVLAAQIAERLAEPVEKVRCVGCRGTRVRGKHWTSTCWILACCVDQHHLSNCSECDQFPCKRLSDWAARGAKYSAALERLEQIRNSAK